MRRKLAALVLVAFLALAATSAFAKEGNKSVEATLNYGTESFDGLDGQFGATIGAGYEFIQNLQGRIDISYLRSSKDFGGMDITATRVPLDFSVRCLHQLTKVDRNLTAFGQAGVELSFDEFESSNETNVGLVIGGGAEYKLDPQFGALVNVQYHIIEGGYLSVGIGGVYHF